eukprot:Em0243g6a
MSGGHLPHQSIFLFLQDLRKDPECHMMLAFLKQKIPDLYVDAISLSDLIAYLKADQDKLIDPQFCRHVREGVIKWRNETGVTTIVEMSETFQSLSLAMFSPDRESHKYVNVAHAVLLVIKTACQEFCPHLEVLELISYPSKASSDHSDDAKVQHSSLKAHPEGVELSLLKKALLEGVELSSLKNVLIEGDKHVSDVNVPSSQLMSELTNHVQKLEDDGSSASIFMCTLMDLMNDITSKIPAKWRSVDIQLGLPSGILDSIEEEVAGKPRACLDSFEQVSLPGNDNAPVHTPGIPSLSCELSWYLSGFTSSIPQRSHLVLEQCLGILVWGILFPQSPLVLLWPPHVPIAASPSTDWLALGCPPHTGRALLGGWPTESGPQSLLRSEHIV